MKNKFNVNSRVEHPVTKKKLIVKDLELIDNEYIYYFDDFQCFPEKMLRPYLFSFVKKLLSYTQEERDNMSKKSLENLDNEIDEILKNDI
jgi:hypothetical protein